MGFEPTAPCLPYTRSKLNYLAEPWNVLNGLQIKWSRSQIEMSQIELSQIEDEIFKISKEHFLNEIGGRNNNNFD